MRITTLLIFIITLCMTNALLVSLGIFQTAPDFKSEKLLSHINETATTYQYRSAEVQDVTKEYGVGDFLAGLWLFIQVASLGIVLPYTILTGFGIPISVALVFTIPIYFIYIVSVIQILSGRYLE